MQFVPERGKIQPRRLSGTSAKWQRKLQLALKRARELALIPYATGLGCHHDRSHPQGTGRHLGGRGDIVKVADGYARNYLLPRKLALR